MPFKILVFYLGLHLYYMVHADQEKKMNATYIISIARKLGCSIFLLPEDITEVVLNQT